MNVVQTSEGGAVWRQKQLLRETANKDEARAQELSRSGIDDLYTSNDRSQAAEQNRSSAAELSKQANTSRRRGQRQNKRGLENLANGSDRTAEGFAKTEQGLAGLKSSLEGLQTASEQKTAGLETAKQGLSEQARENVVQGGTLQKFSHLQKQDAKLDGQKASQLFSLEENLSEREVSLQRQGQQLDSYLIAGETFAQGTEVKAKGYDKLHQATGHSVKAEALGDAREGQKLRQTWGEADQARHQESSSDLALSSLYQSLKAKAEQLNAAYHKRNSERDQLSADGLSAQACDLRTQSGAAAQRARVLEQSGQCHVTIGRQMQCFPWSYCQGVALERQGCAELAEAQRLKSQAKEMRQEAQSLAIQAETLRAKAEDSLARGEESETKSHGSMSRSELLEQRSVEHKESAAKSGETAERAEQAAVRLEVEAQREKSSAAGLRNRGVASLERGFLQQDEALARQDKSGAAFGAELVSEAELTAQSQATTQQALGTVAKDVSYIGRGNSLLNKLKASQAREGDAQDKLGRGIDGIESGVAASNVAHQQGVEAAQLLEQARDLELEGLKLQNRGQKMLLEARPKLAQAAKLSAESFDAASRAERQEEDAARLIESGNQKLAAAAVLREKAASYREIAG